MSNNSLFLRALRNEPVERPPVWMMRQAGRYMPEYRALKEKHTFLELCKTPELAVEVTMQPLRAFDVDAAILFSDILIPLEGMGLKIDFNPGPQVKNPIKSPADVSALTVKDPNSYCSFVGEALSVIKREVKALPSSTGERAVIGFAGAPWTMACYMMDQGPFKHFHGTQIFANEHRKATHEMLAKLTEVVTSYLLFQIESGAEAVQLFDTWAGNLSVEDYREFALPYTRQILSAVARTQTPTALYVNGSAHLLEEMVDSGADCIGLDWRVSLTEAASRIPQSVVVQGNLDPTRLFSDKQRVISETEALVSSWKRRSGFIANLGHGILQRTPMENVTAFVETVRAGWR